VFFAVARAQNNALARYFMERGAKPGALFAAAWWGNGGILADMVRHGADINEVVGVTPLHWPSTSCSGASRATRSVPAAG
jgi:hypothetical protein